VAVRPASRCPALDDDRRGAEAGAALPIRGRLADLRAGIGLAFVSAKLSLLIYAALAVYYLVAPVPAEIGDPRGPLATDIEPSA